MTPGDVRVALPQRAETFHAAGNRRKDGAARDGPASGGDEHREQGVIASRGQQGTFAPAAPLPDLGQVLPGLILQPRIDEAPGKEPFPRGLGPRQATGLEEGIDLLLMDMEIPGQALGVHPLILRRLCSVIFHGLAPGNRKNWIPLRVRGIIRKSIEKLKKEIP
jgi:hypothetical protein